MDQQFQDWSTTASNSLKIADSQNFLKITNLQKSKYQIFMMCRFCQNENFHIILESFLPLFLVGHPQ